MFISQSILMKYMQNICGYFFYISWVKLVAFYFKNSYQNLNSTLIRCIDEIYSVINAAKKYSLMVGLRINLLWPRRWVRSTTQWRSRGYDDRRQMMCYVQFWRTWKCRVSFTSLPDSLQTKVVVSLRVISMGQVESIRSLTNPYYD